MKRLNKKGFTLVELLAVIVVLALLMVVAASSIGSALDNSKRSATLTEAKKLLTGIGNEAQSLALMGEVKADDIKKIYTGTDGDYKYDVTVNKSGKVTALIVCGAGYSVTASGTPLAIGDKVDDTTKTCTGSVTVSES